MIEHRPRELWEQLQGKRPHFPHRLTETHLSGIRGIDNLRVVFDYPVSVIADANASGESAVHLMTQKRNGNSARDLLPKRAVSYKAHGRSSTGR